MKALLGDNFVPVICDVADWEEVDQVFAQFPPVDVLINSAGITGRTNMKSDETDPAEVERVFRINFFGSYHTSKAVLPKNDESRVRPIASHRLDRRKRGQRRNARLFCLEGCRDRYDQGPRQRSSWHRRYGERPGPSGDPDADGRTPSRSSKSNT